MISKLWCRWYFRKYDFSEVIPKYSSENFGDIPQTLFSFGVVEENVLAKFRLISFHDRFSMHSAMQVRTRMIFFDVLSESDKKYLRA